MFASLDSSARVTQIKETKNNGISLFLSSLTSSYKHVYFLLDFCSFLIEEKTNTDKNMSTMFDFLRRNKTIKLETLVLNRTSC